jgi:dolichol kinase
MIGFQAGIWLYATVILCASLVVISAIRISKFKKKDVVPVLAAMAAGAVLFYLEREPGVVIAALEIGIVTFNGLLSERRPVGRNAYVVLSLLYIALIHWVGLEPIAQALLIGLLSGISNLKESRSRVVNRKVEIERDVFHICAGIALISVFFFASTPLAITLLLVIVLGGIFIISIAEIYGKKGRSGFFYRLERNGSSLGRGAMWLALGSLLPASFLGITGILVVFFAIFIGDPLATIVGIRTGRHKLPYNKSKSVEGAVAYFAAAAAIAYMLVGPYAVVVAAVAALVESMDLGVDDNFTVSAALTVMLLVLGV